MFSTIKVQHMKKILLLIYACSGPLCASTSAVNVSVKGAITSATCIFTPDSEVNFGSITALSVNNNSVPAKEINMTINCDSSVSNIKLTFTPQTVLSGNNKVMSSGLAGVGFTLPKMGIFSNLDFNSEYVWSSFGISGSGTRVLAVKIKPVRISTEKLDAGSIDTTLTIRVSYD